MDALAALEAGSSPPRPSPTEGEAMPGTTEDELAATPAAAQQPGATPVLATQATEARQLQ